MGIVGNILGIFFTNTCPVCGQAIGFNNQGVCKECKGEIKYVREPRCKKCGKPLEDIYQTLCTTCTKRKHHFDMGLCVFEHSGEIRKSIYDFKYGNRRDYSEFYADEAAKVYGRILREWDVQAIVPVPIHKDKEIERGYNQALEFGRALGRKIGIPVERKVLIRRKKTTPQKELTEIMRYLNLKNAFAVDISRLENVKRVLIVDDIYTTGSTIDACSSILKNAGVEKVYFLCISAGMDGNCK